MELKEKVGTNWKDWINNIKKVKELYSLNWDGTWYDILERDALKVLSDAKVYLADNEFIEKWFKKLGISDRDIDWSEDFDENGNLKDSFIEIIGTYEIIFNDNTKATVDFYGLNTDSTDYNVDDTSNKGGLAKEFIANHTKINWDSDELEKLAKKTKNIRETKEIKEKTYTTDEAIYDFYKKMKKKYRNIEDAVEHTVKEGDVSEQEVLEVLDMYGEKIPDNYLGLKYEAKQMKEDIYRQSYFIVFDKGVRYGTSDLGDMWYEIEAKDSMEAEKKAKRIFDTNRFTLYDANAFLKTYLKRNPNAPELLLNRESREMKEAISTKYNVTVTDDEYEEFYKMLTGEGLKEDIDFEMLPEGRDKIYFGFTEKAYKKVEKIINQFNKKFKKSYELLPESNKIMKINLKEGREGFTIVWITSNHSVTKSGIMDIRSYEKVYNEVKKEMKDIAHTDDFWIDDIWYDGRNMPSNIDWKDVLMPKGLFDKDIFEMILQDSDISIKVQFLQKEGFDITENNLEEVNVYDASKDKWIEGNFKSWYPESWLDEQAENYYPDLVKALENANAYSYFDDGFARIFSDNEVNGDFRSQRIGDYFCYTYMR